MSAASDQITQYLSVGGLFNPEIMNQTHHEAVRDTLIKAQQDIHRLERENAELRARLELWRDGAITRERDHENTALRSAAVEVAAIGRVWVTVWGDQLSGDSVRRFSELEQQILRRAKP